VYFLSHIMGTQRSNNAKVAMLLSM